MSAESKFEFSEATPSISHLSADLQESPHNIAPAQRVFTDGKFFRIGSNKFYPKGVTYGPFQPTESGIQFPTQEQVKKDFALIKKLNANCIRVYHTPPRWLLDLAQEFEIKILVDAAWPKHTCFLDDPESINQARVSIRKAAQSIAGHPAIFALTLANEIPPDIARWYGAPRIEDFVNELGSIVKQIDPQMLITFANFPPTEFLQPACVDFLSFNVYLHDQKPFGNYLDRLQSIAGDKPLVLTEFGIDSVREGEDRKSQILEGHIETAFRAGVAGTFIFAFTDDWHTGGHQIDNWFFGLTSRDRSPRPSFYAVANKFKQVPHFPLQEYPKVSIVVASYNGARTLPSCLDSLAHLNYPNYEVILVDDGSTDDTAKIVAHYPDVRTIHQENKGLSAARNVGIAASTGQIIAFTDSDCRPDEDWLYYLVGDLLKTDAAAIGGHNLPPREDTDVAACVAVSPGGPAHVMLDDRNAEHIPGCNMAFWKWSLDEIGGFDPQFRAAGDDVDVCWRILQSGYRIVFSHSGFVWHYRRNSVAAYLKQQRGYGAAEALLRHKHPEYFNTLGGMRWRGRIYSPTRLAGLFGRFVIYHGVFGSALFQTLYTPEPASLLSLPTSLEWHILVTGGSIFLAGLFPALWLLPVLTILATLAVAIAAAMSVKVEPKHSKIWSKALVATLFILQPIVRAWPRYAGGLSLKTLPKKTTRPVGEPTNRFDRIGTSFTLNYWNEKGIERIAFLHALLTFLDRNNWQEQTDSGWDEFDVTIYGDKFTKVIVKTVSENHGGNKRLLRAMLTTRWNLLAKTIVCSVAIAAAVIVNVSSRAPWSFSTLALLPVAAAFFQERARKSLRLGIELLDATATRLGLTNLDTIASSKQVPLDLTQTRLELVKLDQTRISEQSA